MGTGFPSRKEHEPRALDRAGWWKWFPPPGWRSAPRWLLSTALFGIAWGVVALSSVPLGRRVLNVQPCFVGTAAGDLATVALGVLSIGQGVLVLARRRIGLYVFWTWSASLVGSAWAMYEAEYRLILTVLTALVALGLDGYAWRHRWWFDRERSAAQASKTEPRSGDRAVEARGAREGMVGIDATPFAESYAIFRDLFPRKYRHLPPFFYQFIGAGLVFGIFGLAASVTILPLMGAGSPTGLVRISIVVVPIVSVLGIVQAMCLLRRARLALWSVYAWFVTISLSAWIYLPRAAESPRFYNAVLAPLLVTGFLGLWAYYFWNRREWFSREDR